LSTQPCRIRRSFAGAWLSWSARVGARRSWPGGSNRRRQAIRNWVKHADLDEGRREDGLATEEREELRRLRRENKTLRLEREILQKAAAWFARETGSISPESSGS